MSDDGSTRPPGDGALLPRHLCRVMGTNQNHSSRSGTSYHVQVEDRGPVFDDATEEWVRRVNVIAYANYGEPTARIVYGKDHDFPDLRTHEHNRMVAQRLQELAVEVRAVLEEKEERQVARVKGLLEQYYRTRDDKVKREFEDANALYPFVFARAFQELKAERSAALEAAAAPPPPAALPAEIPSGPLAVEEAVYPMDATLRELVLEIERVAEELQRDLAELRSKGGGRRHPPGDLRQAPGPGEGQRGAAGHVERLRGPPPRHDAQQPGDRLPPGPGPGHSARSGVAGAGGAGSAASSLGARERASLRL